MPNEHQCSPCVGKYVQYCSLHTGWQDPGNHKESDRFSDILQAVISASAYIRSDTLGNVEINNIFSTVGRYILDTEENTGEKVNTEGRDEQQSHDLENC